MHPYLPSMTGWRSVLRYRVVSPEFDTFLRNVLYLKDVNIQNWHYNAIFEGFGRLTASNRSFCSGVRVVSPLADCLRWSLTW